jgi:multiple antibiotic resistance protein
MSLFTIAFSLFILMDSLGNIPLYIAFLKEIPPKRQRWIILREMLIALFVIVLFNFIGDGLLRFLGVTEATVQIAGGIILFIIALKMIFPPAKDPHLDLPHDSEPFIVPLAIPLVAGPSVLASVIIYGHQESGWIMIAAIAIAWFFSLLILLLAPTIKNALTWRGIVACERLMGLILTLIAVQMFLSGLYHHQVLMNNKTASIPLLFDTPAK